MLIVPLSEKMNWRNPPWLTVLLILVNIFIYFGFQRNDGRVYLDAVDYYFESGLAQMELPVYVDYLEANGEEVPAIPESKIESQLVMLRLQQALESDAVFLRKLHGAQLEVGEDFDYDHWSDLRHTYEDRRAESVTFSYGFRPAYPSATGIFTYMFLHGSVGHLIGNMVMLWLVGCMLEMGCGRLIHLGIYLVSGLAAGAMFWVCSLNSAAPLVGASGAIAGFMGAFTAMYGRKKIKIFFSLGFYFNNLRVPAIVLLPVWLGKELYQLFWGGTSQVAYTAHLGGLICGAGLAFVIKRLGWLSQAEVFEVQSEDNSAETLAKALDCIDELDMTGARRYLHAVLDQDPNHIDALQHLYNIEKLEPESPRCHQVASRLLMGLIRRKQLHAKAFEIYQDYTRHVARPRLTPELYVRLCAVFATLGQVEIPEKIMRFFLKKRPDLPGLPEALLRLADACNRKHLADKQIYYLELICSRYPQSTESQIAAQQLNR